MELFKNMQVSVKDAQVFTQPQQHANQASNNYPARIACSAKEEHQHSRTHNQYIVENRTPLMICCFCVLFLDTCRLLAVEMSNRGGCVRAAFHEDWKQQGAITGTPSDISEAGNKSVFRDLYLNLQDLMVMNKHDNGQENIYRMKWAN